ncbi:MAG: helix-turn-helix domain-containing protein [Anaerolineales bacterium]|jgi:transcriptional regulator with XRE-family HTH domain|nr:helix-turn-helix domain-containing protein [Anaerolineales bacterium]
MDLTTRQAVSIDVGIRLRQLREKRGVSMRTLATMSGLSANALSMIERGKTSPSVSTLYRLAEALEVPVTQFFSPEPVHESVVFLKADERARLPFTRGLWEGLGGENFVGHVMPFMLTLESGASSGPSNVIHTGHEFVFCVRGQLEYRVEGQSYLLESGDSLLFAANLNHRWRNPGNTVASVLIVLADFSEGEQAVTLHLQQ